MIILDSSIPSYEFNKILEIDSDIIAVDYKTHTKLVNSNKKHELLDNYLEENERIDLYNFVLSKYDWYKNLSDNSKFEFNKINILSLMSPLEFHEYVLGVLIKLQSIKIEQFFKMVFHYFLIENNIAFWASRFIILSASIKNYQPGDPRLLIHFLRGI